MKTKLLIVALSLFGVNHLKAQYTMMKEAWRSVNTETNNTQVLSVDMKTSGGNIYQLGKLNNGSNLDVVIAKISNAGSVLWQQVYNGGTEDTPVSIGVDNSGNSYAIMTSVVSGTNRMRVVKYNTSGVQQWIWTQTGGVLGSVAVNGTTDVSGNTYVIGTDAANNVIKTYKISNAGASTWAADYTPNGFSRNGSMVVVDGSSNVYLCGWQNTTANGVDWVTLKYNSAGTQQWVQTYGGTGNDTAKTLIIDGGSNIIVGGKYNSSEAHVRKYTAAGATSWTNTVDLSVDDNSSVVLQYDNSNNVYAAACRQIYSSSRKQTHLKKISSTGTSLWDQYYSGTSVPLTQPNQIFENYPKQILVHNDSNYVYVGIDGTSKDNAGFVSRGFHIARFRTSDGSYNVTFDNVSHNFSYPDLAYTNTIAFADNNQSIIITGSHKDGTPYKIRTVKYNNYTPVVKADGVNFQNSTSYSYRRLCDVNARGVSDSIQFNPTGLQTGYTYLWVLNNINNEDLYTERFTDRTNPNSYYYSLPGDYLGYEFRLKITDSNGNVFYSLPVSVRRDEFDPTVTLSGSATLCSGSVELSLPQIGTSYALASMIKIGTPNLSMSSYAGLFVSQNDSLVYTASISGQYYFDVERNMPTTGNSYNSTTCYYSSDTITVQIGAPTITGTTPNNRCDAGVVTLGATASAGTLSWYAASTGGSVLGTGTSFVTPSISSTTTYYVESTDGSCTSARTAVVATVNTTPTITGTTPNNRCDVGTVTLGATASAGTLSWFAASTGGSVLGTGTSFVTPSISSTTTYYVESSNGGCTSPRTAVVATVNTTPTITGTTPNNRCDAGTVTLGATASAGTLSWYAASTGGSSLGTGTSFVTPSISSTTTYYVEASNGGCTSPRTAVVATVNTTPTITGTTPNNRCDAGTVTLGATASAGTLSWFAAPTGGSSLGTGTSFVTPSISSTTTYYVEASNGGCTSPRTAVVATVNTTPTITGTTPNNRCDAGTVTLGATASAGTLSWYAASTGGVALGTGTSFVTPSISSTTTYYVEASNGGCTSPRTAVTATVNNSPTATVNQTGNTLTVQESGLSYQWVDCNNSNAPIFGENGQSFNVTVNGNYAVEVTENGCVTTSNCTNVTVTNVESISTINEFSIYPNPVADEHVSIHSTQGVEQLKIYDAIGKIVYFQNFSNEKQLTISLQNFEKGIYFIQVNKTIQKLIVE